jgi:hypothetical protein
VCDVQTTKIDYPVVEPQRCVTWPEPCTPLKGLGIVRSKARPEDNCLFGKLQFVKALISYKGQTVFFERSEQAAPGWFSS